VGPVLGHGGEEKKFPAPAGTRTPYHPIIIITTTTIIIIIIITTTTNSTVIQILSFTCCSPQHVASFLGKVNTFLSAPTPGRSYRHPARKLLPDD
jgi:hypothetical protein